MSIQSHAIRLAHPDDRPALIRLMASLQDFEGALHPNRAPGEAIAAAHLGYLEQLAAAEGCMLVAEADGAVVGFVCAFVEATDDGDLHLLAQNRRYGVISDLYVIAALRGQGIGRALIEAAEAHLWRYGVRSVRLTVLAANYAAQRAYERAGYRPYEITYEHWREPTSGEE